MRFLRLFLFTVLSVGLIAASGCSSPEKPKKKKRKYPETVARFLLEATDPKDAGAVAHLPTSGVAISVEPKAYFTEYDIEKCEVVNNELGKGFAFKLTTAAARDLYKMSVPNQGKRLVTMVNGRPIGARRIDGALNQGYIVTYIEVPEDELEDMAKNITRTSTDMREEMEKKAQ